MTASLRHTIAVLAALLGGVSHTAADVKASSVVRYYSVPGTTAQSLIRTIAANPLGHNSAGAIARTDATFDLSMTVANRGAACEATDAVVTVTFVTTLPRAAEAAMTAATRLQWRGLVDFARRHETMHKTIYLQCVGDFVRMAKVLKSPSGCDALLVHAARQFDLWMKACGARHDAFDAAESRRLKQLPIFRSAR